MQAAALWAAWGETGIDITAYGNRPLGTLGAQGRLALNNSTISLVRSLHAFRDWHKEIGFAKRLKNFIQSAQRPTLASD